MTQFPAFLQAAMLFDRCKPMPLEALVHSFLAKEASNGESYRVAVDTRPGAFYRLLGPNQVMVTIEYVEGRAQTHLFEAALGSPYTQIVTPDARARIAAHQSHILIGVHHGSLPPTGEIGNLLKQLGVPSPGANLPAFKQRLWLCWALTAIANVTARASLIHWTSSDHLLTGEVFAKIEAEPPSLLHIHPLLFGAGKNAKGQPMVEIKTHGVAHFLGRDIHILPCPAPWPELTGAILAFTRLAMLDKGYIIPDGDTFSDADASSPNGCSIDFRVRHIAEGAKSGGFDGPLYQFELLYSRTLNYQSPDYIPPKRTFDDRGIPLDVAHALGAEKDKVAREWRATRQMAEAAGMQFQVKAESKTPVGGSLFGRLGRVLPFGRRK
jgi:hypothetical protein